MRRDLALAAVLLFAFAPAQDEAGRLVRALEEENLEARDDAARRLRAMGNAALPALRKSSSPAALQIKARILWLPVIPPWVETADPAIAERLDSADPAVSTAAYKKLVKERVEMTFLHTVIMRHGSPELKRLAITDWYRGDLDDLLDVLGSWDFKRFPIGDEALQHMALRLAWDSRRRHVDRIRALKGERLASVRTVALAARGDEEGRAAVLELLAATGGWSALAARVFRECPYDPAALRMIELLPGADDDVTEAILEALMRHPGAEMTEAVLVAIDHTGVRNQEKAVELIEKLGLDASEPLLKRIESGSLFPRLPPEKPRVKEEGDEGGPLRATSGGFSVPRPSDCIPQALGKMLRRRDDPETLARVAAQMEARPWLHHTLELLLYDPGPRVKGRLDAIYLDPSKTDAALAVLVRKAYRRYPLSVDIAALEAAETPEACEVIWKCSPRDRRLDDALRARLLAVCKRWASTPGHPGRLKAAVRLQELGDPDGEKVVRELAAPDTDEAAAAVDDVGDGDFLVEKLKSTNRLCRHAAAIELARRKHAAAPAALLDIVRRGEPLESHSTTIGELLLNYDANYSDKLTAVLPKEAGEHDLRSVLRYVGDRGTKQNVAFLLAHVESSDPYAQDEALRALALVGDADSFDAVAKV